MTTLPYEAETDRLSVFARAVIDRLVTRRMELTDHEGRAIEVWYGEQSDYPTVPAVAVATQDKGREFAGYPRMFTVQLDLTVTLYYTKILDTVEKVNQDADELGERIEDVLHTDPKFGGLVRDSFSPAATSGFVASLSGSKYRAYRILFRGLSKKGLPLT